MNKIEQAQYCIGFAPVDMAAAANDGDWISLKNYNHVEIIVVKAAGAAGEPATLTLEQATDVSGAGAKALPFTRLYVKNGADLQAVGLFTQVTQASANTYSPGAGTGNQQGLWVVEFDAQDLDVAGGFDCLRARVADVGVTAQIGTVLYRLSEPRFGQAQNLSAIVN